MCSVLLFTLLFYKILSSLCLQCLDLPSVLWRCWLGGRKGIQPVKTEWWGVVRWNGIGCCGDYTRYYTEFVNVCHQQGHVGSKTLHQQNPSVLNWRCWLMQVDLYNGRKTVVVGASLWTFGCECCSSLNAEPGLYSVLQRKCLFFSILQLFVNIAKYLLHTYFQQDFIWTACRFCCLQCFDTVGCRQEGHPACKKLV